MPALQFLALDAAQEVGLNSTWPLDLYTNLVSLFLATIIIHMFHSIHLQSAYCVH